MQTTGHTTGLLGTVPAPAAAPPPPAPAAVPEPRRQTRTSKDVLGELDALVGLESVKREVRALTDMIEVVSAGRRPG